MFKIISSFKNKFKSFKKTYKINMFYIKNKKSNFLSSLSNYSKTNKSKTYSNVNYSVFSYKINSRALAYYALNFIILAVFVYFKYNSIIYYFKEVLPFEIRLSIPTYIYLGEFCLEFFLMLWWVAIFFINDNFIKFIIFVDANIINLNSLKSSRYFFLFRTLSEQETPINKNNRVSFWKQLSLKTFLVNLQIQKKKSFNQNSVSFKTQNYDEILRFNFKNKPLTYFNWIKKNNFIKNYNSFFNFKYKKFSNSIYSILVSQKNLINNNKTLNNSLGPVLWSINKNLYNSRQLFKQKAYLLPSKTNFSNFFIIKNDAKILLKNKLNWVNLNTIINKTPLKSSFFNKI